MESHRDVRLRSLIAQLAVAATQRRPPARPRIYRPGPRALAAMTTRQLIHETITTYRFREEARFPSLADEFTDRGAHLAAHFVGLGLGIEAIEAAVQFAAENPLGHVSSTPQSINAGIDELLTQVDLGELDGERQGITTITTMVDLIDQDADPELLTAFDDVVDVLVPNLSTALQEQSDMPAVEAQPEQAAFEASQSMEL